MKTLVLLSSLLLATLIGAAQITITEPTGSTDLNGSTYTVTGQPTSFDIEHGFLVTNTGDSEIEVGCRRIETDVLPGTGATNTMCWVLCPAYVDAGSQAVLTSVFTVPMAAGAVESSFAMHLRPQGVDGCSSFRIEWFDASNPDAVLATVDMMFDHSAVNSCAVGLDDLLNDVDITLAPNPASDFTALTLDGLRGTVEIQVIDVLGQVISSDRLNSVTSNTLRLDTSSLRNGIYFVAINDGMQAQRTLKMNVRH